MRRYRCFAAPQDISGNRARLSPAESHYLQHVLRLSPGSTLELFDGQGHSYRAVLRCLQPSAEAEILEACPEPQPGESPLRLVLVQALIRADPFEWVLQKGTELGVHAFFPLHGRHCEIHPGSPESQKNRQLRWEKIVQAAARQCRRSAVPIVHPVADFSSLKDRALSDPATLRMALLEEGGRPFTDLPALPEPPAVQLWIGPEGGWSADEAAFLRSSCFPLSLGPRVLRAETAAVAAAALLQSLWGDLSGHA